MGGASLVCLPPSLGYQPEPRLVGTQPAWTQYSDGVRLGCTVVVNLGLTADSRAVCNFLFIGVNDCKYFVC